MKPLPQPILFYTSGVRGRNVYELTTRRQLVTGSGNSRAHPEIGGEDM